jgi:type II secretory pathway component GspD/PulD (secretin)
MPFMFSRALKYGFLVFLLTAPTVMAQEKLEVIPLKNRRVEDVIPIIRPLLGRNEKVSGMRDQLIVRASPIKLREIKTLLEKIDAQLTNLRITVKQGFRSQLNKMEQEIEAAIPIGEAGRVIINPGDKGGLIIGGKAEKGSIRGRFLQRKASLDEMNTQVVTTLEGNAATIYFTRRIPLKETRSFSTGNKVTQLESIRFRDVRSGFMVLPQIRGDQVILEISPQQSRITNGEIETVGLNTIVRGRIGEWIELGGLNQNRNEQSSGIASRNTSGQVEKRSVFIKVEKQ